jgi:hypothetical protein
MVAATTTEVSAYSGMVENEGKAMGSSMQAPRVHDGVEVTVTHASDNLPDSAVLMVAAGLGRRQVRMELQKPLVVARPVPPNCSVKVTLGKSLATQSLTQETEGLCSLPVRRPDGTESQVKLRVRQDGPTARAKPEEALAAAKDYLEQHQLQRRIQEMIQEVLRVQPSDPYSYMLEQLHKSKAKVPALSMKSGPDEHPSSQGHRPPPGMAQWTVRTLLETPRCTQVAKASLQEEVCRNAAASMAESSLSNFFQKAETGFVEEPQEEDSVGAQARAVVRLSLKGSAVLMSPDYKRAVTRWTINCSIRAAVTPQVVQDPDESASLRRSSLPMPMVYLGGDCSWGAMLSNGSRRSLSACL